MTETFSEQAELIMLDRQIEELKQRIDCLKERMATMTSQRYETKNQSILLSTMQEVLGDLHLLRLEMLGAAARKKDDSGMCDPSSAHSVFPAIRRHEERLGAR